MALGEIIDRSATFWRGQVKPLFMLFLGFQLVQFIFFKTWELLLNAYLPAARGGSQALDLMKTAPDEALVQVAIGSGAAIVVTFVTFFISQVGGVAASRFIYPRVLGQPGPTVAEGLRFALSRLGTTLGAFVLALSWSALVALLFLAPSGVLVAVAIAVAETSRAASLGLAIAASLAFLAGFVLTMLWFIIRFILMSQVIALENTTALQVFRRTGQLSSGRVGPGLSGLVKGRLTVLITVVGAIILLASLVSGVPQLIVQVVYGNIFDPAHADPNAIPQLLMVPAQLLQVVVGSLVSPLYVVLQVMFYVDMRVRREGLDLELQLKGAPA